MNHSYDVVIIGSGAGGGTVAEYLSRFADQGLKILLLERGPYWPKENFTQREIEMSKIFYNRGAVLSKDRSIALSTAKTVGGSTAVYTGVSFRPPADVLASWRDEFGLSFLTDQYAASVLDEIEQQIGVHELSESMDNDNNRLFKKGCDALGIGTKRLRINTRGCEGQGFCNLGCTKGAKQGTLEVQIPQARSRGVDVVWNAHVNEIISGDRAQVRLTINPAAPYTLPNDWPEGDHTVLAKTVVISGGTLNTPVILAQSPSLKINRSLLGRYVTLHPAYNVNGIYKEAIKNYRGFPKSFYVDDFSDTDHYYLETSFYYPGVTAKNTGSFGPQHQSIMDDYQKMMSILILVHDEAEKHNQIALNKKTGEAVLDYTVSKKVTETIAKALHRATDIFFAAGCDRVAVPLKKNPVITADDASNLSSLFVPSNLDFKKAPLSTAHPQGGARMAADDKTGIVSPKGHLFNHENIFVADASLFPTSVKVNPYETVMLLARYVAEQVAARHGVEGRRK